LIGQVLQWAPVKPVKPVATFSTYRDEPGFDQHVDVLRDRLPCRRDRVSRCQPGTQLEERLVVAINELVKDRAPSRVRQRLEHVAHRAGQ
jgi:hypothetical protein